MLKCKKEEIWKPEGVKVVGLCGKSSKLGHSL